MHQHHVHLPMYWGDAQSVATKNKQPRSIFVLVPVLLSLDTFPYVSAANLGCGSKRKGRGESTSSKRKGRDKPVEFE